MTEIPEHLLKRSQAAKAAKTGDTGGADAAPAAASEAAPVAAAAAPAIDPASLPNLDPEPEPPTPEPAYVTASKARRRIPAWALPMVAALPVWAVGYAGTMQQPEGGDPLFEEAAAVYANAGCGGCHGADGGGGAGYAFAGGEVLATFPNAIDQMVHVARGSGAIQGQAYGAEGRRVAGDLGEMPAQMSLTMVELEMVVFHERAVLSGEDTHAAGYEEWMDHIREGIEAHDETGIDLDLLLACADPEVTPGATGAGGEDCPGPHAE